MYFSRKEMSKASEAIFREQRQIRKERLLSSPALLIGTVGFLIILFAALLVPMFSRSECNDRVGAVSGAWRQILIRNR